MLLNCTYLHIYFMYIYIYILYTYSSILTRLTKLTCFLQSMEAGVIGLTHLLVLSPVEEVKRTSQGHVMILHLPMED